MKGVSQSFEAASVQPAARNVNDFSAPAEWRLPVIGLCVFAGYYLGAKLGFALVRQQLIRSNDRRGSDVLPDTWTNSVHKPSQRGNFLPLCRVRRSVSIVVLRCGVCQMECLGPGQLLGVNPYTIFFKRSGGINSSTVNRNVGDEGDSCGANSWPRMFAGGMSSSFRSALDRFRRSL